MSESVFDAIANEPLETSDQLASDPSSSTEIGLREMNKEFLAGLVELCNQYASSRTNNIGTQLTQTLHTAIGVPRLEAAILTLRGDVAAILLNLLQAMVDIGAFANPHHARRALRLLVKLTAASGSLPRSLYISNVFIEDARNPTCLGGFSDVFRAKRGDKCVALKRLRIYATGTLKESLVQRFNREALVWRQLKHPFILQFLGIDYITFKEFPCMASYWMDHGSLKDYVQENRDQGRNRVRFLWEVAAALGYLHDFGIVHGDIRAANVFISAEEHVQLADFGLAGLGDTMTAAAATATSEGGSIRWTAPEFFSPADYGLQAPRRTRATDVYAYGGLCLEVLTGKIPFSHLSQDHPVLFKIASGVKPPAEWSLASSSGASSLLFSFVDCCWSSDATHRPTTATIAEAFHAQLEGNIIRLEELNRATLALSVPQLTGNRVRKRKPKKENNGLNAQPPRLATDPTHQRESLADFAQRYRQQAGLIRPISVIPSRSVQNADRLQPDVRESSYFRAYTSRADEGAQKDIEHVNQYSYLRNTSRQSHLQRSLQLQPLMQPYTSEMQNNSYYSYGHLTSESSSSHHSHHASLVESGDYSIGENLSLSNLLTSSTNNSLLFNPVDHTHSRYASPSLSPAPMADMDTTRSSAAPGPSNTSRHTRAVPEGGHNVSSTSPVDHSSTYDPAAFRTGLTPRIRPLLPAMDPMDPPTPQYHVTVNSPVHDPFDGATYIASGSILAALNNADTPQPSLAKKHILSPIQLSSLLSLETLAGKQPQHTLGDARVPPVQRSMNGSSNVDELGSYEQAVLSHQAPINLNLKLKHGQADTPTVSSNHDEDRATTPPYKTTPNPYEEFLNKHGYTYTPAYEPRYKPASDTFTFTSMDDNNRNSSDPEKGSSHPKLKRRASQTLGPKHAKTVRYT